MDIRLLNEIRSELSMHWENLTFYIDQVLYGRVRKTKFDKEVAKKLETIREKIEELENYIEEEINNEH